MADVVKIIKLQLPAGKANPAPPVGTVLGPTGINMQEFCTQFNDQTRELGNTIVPAVISIYDDRTFSFILKQPPAAILIKEAAKLQKGSGKPHLDKVATLSEAQVREIAEKKMPDLNANDVEAAMKIISGTARSMGVKVAA